ncbi:MAG TPA: ATP-binding protein, partial [Chloroflexota bacterium]|nr:ATP-binding protein [Chloroflexota bacterium]
GFRAAVVRLFDPVSGAALCRAVYGVDWESMQPPTPPEFISSLMSTENRISRSYMMRIHQQSFEDPEIRPYLYNLPGEPVPDSEWTKEHALIVPLETREHGLIGIISVDEPLDGRIPTVDTIQTLEIFANLAATAIDNARLLGEASEAEALRQLDALKSEFLAAVSHDLRTPLTVIKGSVDLLDAHSEDLSPMQAKLLDGVGRNTQRLLDMVEELLEMIQLEDGRIELDRRLTDIWEVVWDTTESMAVAARGRNQTIDVRRDAHPIWLLLDRSRIQQVLTNLVGNACKYGPENSAISIRVDDRPDEVWVSVQDTGAGIPAEEQRRIFEKFYRAESGSAKVGGTGLGLAICRSLIELHKGRIWVESYPSSGTTFTFSLPKSEQQAGHA